MRLARGATAWICGCVVSLAAAFGGAQPLPKDSSFHKRAGEYVVTLLEVSLVRDLTSGEIPTYLKWIVQIEGDRSIAGIEDVTLTAAVDNLGTQVHTVSDPALQRFLHARKSRPSLGRTGEHYYVIHNMYTEPPAPGAKSLAKLTLQLVRMVATRFTTFEIPNVAASKGTVLKRDGATLQLPSSGVRSKSGYTYFSLLVNPPLPAERLSAGDYALMGSKGQRVPLNLSTASLIKDERTIISLYTSLDVDRMAGYRLVVKLPRSVEKKTTEVAFENVPVPH